MKVFLVSAHPEPTSLVHSLARFVQKTMESEGHEVKVSDLYAMGFKAVVDRADFPDWPKEAPLKVAAASGQAYTTKRQPADVEAEQEKLLWADVVIFAFPLWWYGFPAILKGWIDRVYAAGFTYGRGKMDAVHCMDRFGEGVGVGKRAMLLVTCGGRESHFTERGINGQLDITLWPIQHGMWWYIGLSVLPPFLVFAANHLRAGQYDKITAELRERLLTLETTPPIAYRAQNGGDYELPSLLLKPGLEPEGTVGLDLHLTK